MSVSGQVCKAISTTFNGVNCDRDSKQDGPLSSTSPAGAGNMSRLMRRDGFPTFC
jgi:hypothetical protein